MHTIKSKEIIEREVVVPTFLKTNYGDYIQILDDNTFVRINNKFEHGIYPIMERKSMDYLSIFVQPDKFKEIGCLDFEYQKDRFFKDIIERRYEDLFSKSTN